MSETNPDRLLAMIKGLNMPVAVSGDTGAIRDMYERMDQIKSGEIRSEGSCNPPWSSWGN